jgi:hypothetical protein
VRAEGVNLIVEPEELRLTVTEELGSSVRTIE